MDKKELEISLSKLKTLENGKVELEQYQTEGRLAAELLWKANLDGAIKNKKVADFGCGNGILGIGAQLLSAKEISFVDIDEEALDLAKKNSQERGAYYNIDIAAFDKKIDTVVMNPPFGVQKRKADKVFLEKAMQLSKTIYSIHKIESKTFIKKLAEEHGFEVVEILEKSFRIKRTYQFHKKRQHDVDVGIWVLRKI